MKYWCLILDNFKEMDDVIYFKNYEIAKKSFDAICENYKDEEEFEQDDNSCSWFDPGYSEFSTYVELTKCPLPKIQDKIVIL